VTDHFTRKLAFSNGYMLVGTAGSVSPETVPPDPERNQALDRAFQYVAKRAGASFLGTRFLEQQ
jgi:hypothetical protein